MSNTAYQRAVISIHALREEGDGSSSAGIWQRRLFLSTPSARRATNTEAVKRLLVEFLSTPSARRATFFHQPGQGLQIDFYPRPPRGGRLVWQLRGCAVLAISIHALREEGDTFTRSARSFLLYFYPRPPRGGRLPGVRCSGTAEQISIHALREEGDDPIEWDIHRSYISIHALREEGDYCVSMPDITRAKFLSTPSARRATKAPATFFAAPAFLSTPSARRATALADKEI